MEPSAFLYPMPFCAFFVTLFSNCINHWSFPVDGPTVASLPLTHEGNHSILMHHRCRRDTLLYLRGGAYLTRDGFESALDPLYISSDLLKAGTSSPVLRSATFSSDNLIMAVSGTVLTYNLRTQQLSRATGIPDDVDINQVASFPCCYSDTEWCLKQDSSVVAFNSYSPSRTTITYFLSSDRGQSFSIRQFQLGFPIKGKILGASIFGSLKTVTFLVDREDSLSAQFVYDYIHPTHAILAKPFALPFNVTGNQTSFAQLESGVSSLVVWDSQDIYYSAVAGKAVIKTVVHSRDPSLALADDDTVHQVISNKNGDFAVLTTKGRVYFGREGLPPKIVKLPLKSPLPDLIGNSYAIRFTPTNNIQLLYAVDTNENTSAFPPTSKLQMLSQVVYVQQQLAEVTPPLEKCRHQGFITNFHDRLFYLDLGQTLDLSATVIPGAWECNSYMVSLSNLGILSVNTSVQVGEPLAQGVISTKLFAHVSLIADTLPEGGKDEARGMSTLSMSMYDASLMCHHRKQVVAHVVAGCSPGRHVRIRKNGDEDCTNKRGYAYTIYKDVYDPTFLLGSRGLTATADKTVLYDYNTLDCPIVMYYQDMLKPIVDLYDGDVFVEEVQEDYVVNEINGMFTYSYEKTAKQVGCRSQPQSWLRQLIAQDSPDPATAWTRENYRNCFQDDASGLQFPDRPYEILSSQNNNRLKWSAYNGIMVFNLSVLNPDYSFCQLRGQFAVEVYGVLPQSVLPPLRIMVATCGLGLATVVAFYIGQKLWPGDRDKEEEESKEREAGAQEVPNS
ncbi:cation channel sperm-associated protein subunit delta-like isoform X2 [Acanthaster planci]|uniref:Cation channel sperm-associated auxiliary subunit delta n=1 Tax=Acanthaster planci TaxID=133434 RepID=A0A8B7ZRQ6_ACAPL|nr:cation channel sperm-associated protein subunit delta-like isoform X2 [Acanthaster planci]